MFVSGFDTYVDALGRVATGRGTVVFIEEAEEIGEGFDLVIASFLIGNFFNFSFGVIIFHAEDSAIFYSTDFKFYLRKTDLANPCCRAGFLKSEPLHLQFCKIADGSLPRDFAN